MDAAARVNVEIATEHYTTKSIGAKAAAGFAVHGSNGRAKARVARALGRDDGNSGGGGAVEASPAIPPHLNSKENSCSPGKLAWD